MAARNLFDPSSTAPYEISRYKIGLLQDCPRCFWLDRRAGVKRPDLFGSPLPNVTDRLLKNEFDHYRNRQEPHPLMVRYGIDAVPMRHPRLDEWRNTYRGVRWHDPTTNLIVYGAPDDLWLHARGYAHVADYKSTGKRGPVSLDAPWQESYKRQVEFYTWLMRKNDVEMSDTSYFFYVNGQMDRPRFRGRVEFECTIIAHEGTTDWVPGALALAKETLMAPKPPVSSKSCAWCGYRRAASRASRTPIA